MAAIQTDIVTNENLARWGANVYGAEYVVGGARIDFQDLMVTISEQRAAKIEAQVEPMSKRMKVRNTQLEQLGEALSVLSGIESKWETDDQNDKDWPPDSDISDLAKEGLKLIDVKIPDNRKISKEICERSIQRVKTQIDKRNNEASSDMTRLQSLVDRRDESYSTATSLMQSVADTRSNIIKNM